jgi:hypothetical protein
MKCIRCQHDSKYPERKTAGGKRCPQCKGVFAFEPREGDPLSDMAFKNAIDAVSSNGGVRWGAEHLYYEVCRRKRARFVWPIALIVAVLLLSPVFAAVAGFTGKGGWLLAAVGALIVGAAGAAHRVKAPFVKVDGPTFERLWERWCAVHGTPPGRIVRRPQPSQPPAAEPDLADYSFDRAVICDRARTVDLLLANNFHFENNCAVLSIEGYPPGPFPTVRAMLQRNPRLEVFALHDATPAGCRLARRLSSDPAWFGPAARVKVIDVGLRPRHAGRFQGLLLEAKSPKVIADADITAEEAAWLSSYALELAVIRPEQVVKRLFRAINNPSSPVAPASGAIVAADLGNGGNGGGLELDHDAGAGDGGIDAFG